MHTLLLAGPDKGEDTHRENRGSAGDEGRGGLRVTYKQNLYIISSYKEQSRRQEEAGELLSVVTAIVAGLVTYTFSTVHPPPPRQAAVVRKPFCVTSA